jgi:hypothetical protein
MPVQPYHYLLTLVSMVLFAWLGYRLADKRNRNALVWGMAGALLPPLLLVLLFLKPLDGEPEIDAGELNVG